MGARPKSTSSGAFTAREIGTETAAEKKKRLGIFFRGGILAVMNADCAFYCTDKGAEILSLANGQRAPLDLPHPREWSYLRTCAVSADGDSAVVAEDKGWVTAIHGLSDPEKTKRVRFRAHKESRVNGVGISGDDILVHQSDGKIQRWSLAKQKLAQTLAKDAAFHGVAFSRNGSVAFVRYDDRSDPLPELELWLAPYEKPRTIKLAARGKAWTRELAFSFDGSVLACGLSPTGSDRCFEETVIVDVASAEILGRAPTKPGKGMKAKTELRRQMDPETWLHPLSASEFVIVDLGRGPGEREELAFERWSITGKSPSAREIIALEANKKQLGIAEQISFGPDFAIVNRELVVSFAGG